MTQAPHHGEKQVTTSRLDTYLSEMVSCQINKKPDVQLAITAAFHALLKEGDECVREIKEQRVIHRVHLLPHSAIRSGRGL